MAVGRFDDCTLIEEDYWAEIGDTKAVENEIAKLLPERESWSSHARMFGVKGSDEVEIWKKNGKLSRIAVGISLFEPNPGNIRAILDCASRLACRIHTLQSQAIFDPSITSFVVQAEQCSAAIFIPIGTRLSAILTQTS